MKKKLFTMILVLVLAAGCGSMPRLGANPPKHPKPLNLWQQVVLNCAGDEIQVTQESGDLVLAGAGVDITLFSHPDEDNMLLAANYSGQVISFYEIDLRGREATLLGALEIEGIVPKVEIVDWPRILLQASDDQGNFNWLLLDVAETGLEQVWQHNAWVPPNLRRRPVWTTEGNWYMGPLSGPVITDIIQGTVAARLDNSVCAIREAWPAWAGPVRRSSWFLYPQVDTGIVLLNLSQGVEHKFGNSDLVSWDYLRQRFAWRRDDALGLAVPGSGETALDLGEQIPGHLLWATDAELLFFVTGERDYFGATWKQLWLWDPEEGTMPAIDLPPNRDRWRLLAATEQAVLAASGDNDLWYIDLTEIRITAFSNLVAGDWQWSNGHFVAARGGELVRISPGSGVRVIERNEAGFKVLALIDNYVIYKLDDQVRIRQLIL